MRRVCWIPVALAGLKGALADLSMTMPNSVPACSPAFIQWSGGTSPFSITLQTTLGSTSEGLSFSNISGLSFHAPVIFRPNTLVQAVVGDSQAIRSPPVMFNVTPGDEESCYPSFQAAASSVTVSLTPNLTWVSPSPGQSVPICDMSTSFSWAGGAPPYTATIESLNQEIAERQIFSNITATSIQAMVQLSPNIVAQAVVTDNTGNIISSDPFILNNGTNSKCILSNFGIVPPNMTSLTINPSPPKQQVNVKMVAILLTIGIVVTVIPATLFAITRCRRKRQFKLPDLLEDPHDPHPDPSKIEPYRVMGLYPTSNEMQPTPFTSSTSLPAVDTGPPPQDDVQPPPPVQPNTQGRLSEKGRLQIVNRYEATPGYEHDPAEGARRAVYHTDGGVVEEVDEFPPAYRYSKLIP